MEFEIEEADSQHAHSLPKVCRCEKATKTQTIKSRTCLKKKQTPTSKARTCLVESEESYHGIGSDASVAVAITKSDRH